MFTRINLFSLHIPCPFCHSYNNDIWFCFLFLFTFLPSEGSVALPRIMFFVNKINLHTRLKSEPCLHANLLRKAFKFARCVTCGYPSCFENVHLTILVSSTLNCFEKPVVCIFHSLALTDTN